MHAFFTRNNSLSAKYPFEEQEENDCLHDAIVHARFSFDGKEFAHVSDEAKDLIGKLIVVDPEKRMDAKQALEHPWFSCEDKLPPTEPEEPMSTQNKTDERSGGNTEVCPSSPPIYVDDSIDNCRQEERALTTKAPSEGRTLIRLVSSTPQKPGDWAPPSEPSTLPGQPPSKCARKTRITDFFHPE